VANTLFFGDCLDVMREDIGTASVDLIYLDPPFNSKRFYNASMGGAQWVAFKDTWRWSEAVEDFHALAGDNRTADTMEGLRLVLGEGPKLAYLSYMGNRLRECHRVLKPTGSLYLHCDPTMNYLLRVVMDAVFGVPRFRNEIVWCYRGGGVPKRDFARKHDTIFRYTKTRDWMFTRQFVPYSEASEKLVSSRGGVSIDGKERDLARGATMPDWWTDINSLQTWSPERIGYPTQKPVKLLQRIVEASSSPGDLVLDPFCGCGTTIEAAQGMGRQWVGIDICVKACQVIEERLRRSFDIGWSEIEFRGMPKTRDHAAKLASVDPFQFERWAASLTPWMDWNKRPVADKGIDGEGRYPLRKGQFAKMVAQVKGGKTQPRDIQAFDGARQQARADLGIFTCFENRVTQGMRDAAASTGRFMDAPVIQIYTVEDYFAGRLPQLPRAA